MLSADATAIAELMQARRLEEARECCTRLLRAQAQDATLWGLCGVVHGMLGDPGETEHCAREAIRLRPDFAEAHNNLGLALRLQGRAEEAVAPLREAVRLKPDYADAHYNLGVALSAIGRNREAAEAYRQALAIRPDDPEALNDLGNALQSLRRHAEAVDCYRRALALRPEYPEAHNNLGIALAALHRHSEAEVHYRRVLAIRPDHAQAFNNLGNSLSEQLKCEEAIRCYRRALAINPDYAEAHYNLGVALVSKGSLDEAIGCYRRALVINPGYAEAHCNLGVALAGKGALDEALACYRRAIAIQPDYAEAYRNLGVALTDKGELDEALACYRRAIAIQPDYAEAHFNHALVTLLRADFAEGWKEYEWRSKRERKERQESQHLHFPQPRWDGSDLNRQTILIHCEQGYGDSIQFIRYAPLVKRRGGTVILHCPPQLVRLFQTVHGIDTVVSAGNPLPGFDVHIPLPSLPYIFNTDINTIPKNVPYLFPQNDAGLIPGLTAAARKSIRIGIVWAGSEKHRNDKNRSCAFSFFSELAEHYEAAWFSLQVGPRGLSGKENTLADFPIADIAPHFRDFHDTAVAMMQLDLVITVDTSVAHLAGALGRPVWVLLPYTPDWRWMLGRDDSPWYPTMRLFRQSSPGDWEGLFRHVLYALKALSRGS